MQYFVYIVQCSDGTLYTGFSTDVQKRVYRHNAGKGAKYTRSRRPVKLGFVQWCGDASEAKSLEHSIKKKTRKQKLAMCNLLKTS
jgi:putative endonuclease